MLGFVAFEPACLRVVACFLVPVRAPGGLSCLFVGVGVVGVPEALKSQSSASCLMPASVYDLS